jgi:lipoprotein-anchoring transpeptidase ErfK/SrfK
MPELGDSLRGGMCLLGGSLRFVCIVSSLVALLSATTALAQSPQPAIWSPLQVAPAPAEPSPALPPAEVDAEATRLQTLLRREVPHQPIWSPAQAADLLNRARIEIGQSDALIARPQLVIVVDRNPRVQRLAMVLASPDRAWEILGGSKVSTGQANRKLYYITPTGVFLHTDAILDFRAEGTFNENHIRGLGLKGMRVWDFGWQWARKGWQGNGLWGQIRLMMHATDPDYLAQRLGRPASEGCVRIPAEMNIFLDRNGVLDADYEQAALTDPRYRALLLPDRHPTPLAGRIMVVIDTAQPADAPADANHFGPTAFPGAASSG